MGGAWLFVLETLPKALRVAPPAPDDDALGLLMVGFLLWP